MPRRGRMRDEASHRAAARYRLTVEVAARMLRDGRLPPEAGEPGDRFYTVDEAAEILGTTAYTVRKWIRQGDLGGTKLARNVVRVAPSDVAAFRATTR